MDWISLVAVFASATLLSFLLIPLMKRLAFRYDILDHPGHHKTHAEARPYLGGGAIFGSFMAVVLTGILIMVLLRSGMRTPFFPGLQKYLFNQIPIFISALPRFLWLLAGGTLMFVLGLIDDMRGVGFSYKIKFAGQALAAALVVFSGIRIDFLPYESLNILVTMLWIIGITNSFNLLDNMDGLCGGIALISSVILGVLTIQQGQYFSALLFLTLAGSLLGFLRYNFNPSSIFMGDAGALFIGYMLAVLTVSNSYITTRSVSQLPVVVPVLVLGVPLFDTFSVMVIRWKEGRSFFVGDNSHFSHRLVELGMSTKQAVTFIYLVTICVGVSAILIPELHLFGSVIVLIQEGLVFALITLLMIKGKHLKHLHHAVSLDLEHLRTLHKNNGQALLK
jgi:UDP-GlcNAc:undecaprenyl-phosphate GlcNAc-1-phosphate transferase